MEKKIVRKQYNMEETDYLRIFGKQYIKYDLIEESKYMNILI